MSEITNKKIDVAITECNGDNTIFKNKDGQVLMEISNHLVWDMVIDALQEWIEESDDLPIKYGDFS